MTQPNVTDQNRIFPFSAIVGQDRMKLALILNAINPAIGGVLIRGEKGTAKSTAARSLAALLPTLGVVTGCPYSCDPASPFQDCDFCKSNELRQSVQRQVRLVELPVSATEEAVVGTLDIEAAIRDGQRRFEPGLLASAHRGILYIDEVNLLNDHVVDVLLDSAAMGRNFVEREGISFMHPAQFLLIGTMNPEEGDLRPQFIDRFGLAVEIEHIYDAESRAEIVRRRIAYENDPASFGPRWSDTETKERERIASAKEILPTVQVSDSVLIFISKLCAEHEVDGLRADIVIYKAAQTLAAYEGRTEATFDDVMKVAEMALLHRMRRQPFDDPDLNREKLQEMAQDILDNQQEQNNQSQPDLGDATPPEPPQTDDDSQGGSDENVFQIGDSFNVRPLNLNALDQRKRASHGRRTVSHVRDHRGRYVSASMPEGGKVTDLALDATIRVASPFQNRRRQDTEQNLALKVEPWDLRQKVRESKVGNLVIFVVDASGSMGAQQRMVATKGAVISLLLDAYQRRDKVAMIAFRGTSAEVVVPPTGSAKLAQGCLEDLPTGGRTPMASALLEARKLIAQHKQRDPDMPPLLVLVSDCRANISQIGGDPFEDALRVCRAFKEEKVHSVVLDPAPRSNRFGLVQTVAESLGGDYIPLTELRADAIRSAVRRVLDEEA